MAKIERFNYRNAEAILNARELLAEINEILERLTLHETGTHDLISGLLGQKGWSLKVNLLTDTDYKQDAYKNRIMLEIDLRGSLLDSVHRNLLRAQELYNRKIIDAFVQITEIERMPKFSKIKRHIQSFKSVLTVPIFSFGLS